MHWPAMAVSFRRPGPFLYQTVPSNGILGTLILHWRLPGKFLGFGTFCSRGGCGHIKADHVECHASLEDVPGSHCDQAQPTRFTSARCAWNQNVWPPQIPAPQAKRYSADCLSRHATCYTSPHLFPPTVGPESDERREIGEDASESYYRCAMLPELLDLLGMAPGRLDTPLETIGLLACVPLVVKRMSYGHVLFARWVACTHQKEVVATGRAQIGMSVYTAKPVRTIERPVCPLWWIFFRAGRFFPPSTVCVDEHLLFDICVFCYPSQQQVFQSRSHLLLTRKATKLNFVHTTPRVC